METVVEREGRRFLACWYPQMGGYVGRCLVEVLPTVPDGYCFEVYVWHDGEFPFEEGTPRQLHHCDPEQFIHFGEIVRRFAELYP